ncbi:hypothetical protein G6F42_020055 [Rhizopus arrhizus]|nr:hypothetical protein G6F42_020055 [Rhizopus arrhizus]
MDFISNIGNKRNSRKTNSRRPYTRRTSISSVSSISTSNINTSSINAKKEKTLASLNKLDVFPNYTPQPHNVSVESFINSKPDRLWINTDFSQPNTDDEEDEEKEDLFTQVAKQLDLSAEQFASFSDEQSPITPRVVPKKSRSTTKKSAPSNVIKILSRKQQREKGISYDLILEVAYYIRTSDSWLECFIEDGGMQIIAKELGTIHKKQDRTQNDHKIELEILKCLDTLMNKKSGLQEAFKHARIIDNFCISLISPFIPARTQACESLTAFCFLPNGRSMVLHGMELLKQYGPEFSRFDAWIQALEKTLDGRGKMGSAVGASNDLKMTGMVGAGDSQITQYMFISVLFINTLIRPDLIEDRKERLLVGYELEQAGISNVFSKMGVLNHEHINLAIQKFRDDIEADTIQEEMESYYDLDPVSVFQLLIEATQDTPAYQHLHNILCFLLKIQDNPEKRYV